MCYHFRRRVCYRNEIDPLDSTENLPSRPPPAMTQTVDITPPSPVVSEMSNREDIMTIAIIAGLTAVYAVGALILNRRALIRYGYNVERGMHPEKADSLAGDEMVTALFWPVLLPLLAAGPALNRARVLDIGREQARAERAEVENLRDRLREAEDLLDTSEVGSVEFQVASSAIQAYQAQIRATGYPVRSGGHVHQS